MISLYNKNNTTNLNKENNRKKIEWDTSNNIKNNKKNNNLK